MPPSPTVPREVTARAPTRIDFGGGWTDVPPYCDREGGFVCSAAIDRYAVATLTAGREHGQSPGRDSPLIAAALRRRGITSDAGLSVSLRNDFPVAAGLGGSSAASAAVLGALAAWRGEVVDRVALAEEGRAIEVEELGIAGGRQDHYAATHGGALALTFTDSVSLRRLRVPRATRDELVRWGTLVYTGESRISGDTITAVLGAYLAGEARVVNALARMAALARDMASAVEAGDLHALGELVDEHWSHQRALHPSISTPRIEEIVTRARAAGAAGAKAMGASGGGCVLVLARPTATATVRSAVAHLGDLVPFGLDESGLTIVRDTAA